MRILAIDPGYDRLGIAVLEKQNGKETALFSACVQTDKKQTHGERLVSVGNAIAEAIKKWEPEVLAIESLFLFSNQKTAMKVAEARGAILYEAARANLFIFEYTPLQIKIAVTGYGRSDKAQVTEMVKKLLSFAPASSRLIGGQAAGRRRGDKKRMDDEYDALAIGLTCLASYPHSRIAKVS